MSTIIAVLAVPVCPAGKRGMITYPNIHKSIISPVPTLEGWGYKTDVFKQLMHRSQQNFDTPARW